MRRSKPVDPNGDRRGHIKDGVSIRQRPAAIEDRAVPGHWEGDLLSGPNNSYIATLVERHTRYVMLAKVAGKDTQTVVSALIKSTSARAQGWGVVKSLELIGSGPVGLVRTQKFQFFLDKKPHFGESYAS